MSSFKIGEKVEVSNPSDYYDGASGVVFARHMDGRYIIGFPNTDYGAYYGDDLVRYGEEPEEEPKEEPEEYFDETRDYTSTTMKNLSDIIQHIYSLKDSGAQGIRVDIQSEKITDKGNFETFYKYYWDCDLDE